MNGCCTHYHHQHRHWRNRLRRFVWSSHLPRSPLFFLFISTWWWWKSRVHARVMMMITIMFAATSVSRQLPRLRSIKRIEGDTSSRHQHSRIQRSIDGWMSSNRTLSRKCLFDSSNCLIRANVRQARRSCLIFYLHAMLPPLWSLL